MITFIGWAVVALVAALLLTGLVAAIIGIVWTALDYSAFRFREMPAINLARVREIRGRELYVRNIFPIGKKRGLVLYREGEKIEERKNDTTEGH